MTNALVESVARIISPDLFDSDAEAYLDRLAGKETDAISAHRGELRYGLQIGSLRKLAREKAALIIELVRAA